MAARSARYGQRRQTFEHERNAPDLVRIVAPREHVVGAGKGDPELERADVEIHGVVVEIAQVVARRPVNVHAALAERVKAAI